MWSIVLGSVSQVNEDAENIGRGCLVSFSRTGIQKNDHDREIRVHLGDYKHLVLGDWVRISTCNVRRIELIIHRIIMQQANE